MQFLAYLNSIDFKIVQSFFSKIQSYYFRDGSIFFSMGNGGNYLEGEFKLNFWEDRGVKLFSLISKGKYKKTADFRKKQETLSPVVTVDWFHRSEVCA